MSGLYAPGTTAIREVAEALRGHLESVGFLYVADHRVSCVAVEAVRDMSKAFFALPGSEKLKLRIDRNFRG